DTFGANSSFDVVLRKAGGSSAVQGDYLFRTFIGSDFQNGIWGLVRVGPPAKDVVIITKYCGQPAFTVEGVNTVNPANGHMAATVTITGSGLPPNPPVMVNPRTGNWSFTSNTITTVPQITVTSTQGGTRTATEMCPIQTPAFVEAQVRAAQARAGQARAAQVRRVATRSNDALLRFRQGPPSLRPQQ